MNELVDGPETPASIELGKSAFALFVRALLVSRGEDAEGSDFGAAEAKERLASLVESSSLSRPPPGWEEAVSLLRASDPLTFDDLPPPEAARKVEQVQALLRWLRRQIEPRSPAEVRRAKIVRLGVLASLAVLLIGLLLSNALAPKNLARGKPVMTSSVHPNSTAVPGGLTDGETKGAYGVHTNIEANPWVMVDLEAPVAIHRVKVYNRGDGWFDDCLPLRLEFSEDGHNFSVVSQRAVSFSQAQPWVYNAGGKRARYVRISGKPSGFVALSELEVY